MVKKQMCSEVEVNLSPLYLEYFGTNTVIIKSSKNVDMICLIRHKTAENKMNNTVREVSQKH